MQTKPIYLAGPMTGHPQFNFPAFFDAEAKLKEAGVNVLNPAAEDPPEVQKLAWESEDGLLDENSQIAGKTWGDILAQDVKMISDKCSGVVLLDGWQKSRGARLEATVAMLCKLPIYRYHYNEAHGEPVLIEIMYAYVLKEIFQETVDDCPHSIFRVPAHTGEFISEAQH